MSDKSLCKNKHPLCEGPLTIFGRFVCPACDLEFSEMLKNNAPEALALYETLNKNSSR
jgi:hypothetical protein